MANVARVEKRVETALVLAFLNLEKYLRDQLDEMHEESAGLTLAEQFNLFRKLWTGLRSKMDALGYKAAILEQLSGLEQLKAEVIAEAKSWGYPDEKFDQEFMTQVESAVDILLEGADLELAAVATYAAGEIEQLLRRSALGAVEYADLIIDIKNKLKIKQFQAITVARTTLHSFNSMLLMQHAEQAGVKWFAYLGPRDKETRDWCKHWVGRRGTMKMFEATAHKWKRGKHPSGVKVWRGGWNCRHRFVPLVGKDDLKEFKRGHRTKV